MKTSKKYGFKYHENANNTANALNEAARRQLAKLTASQFECNKCNAKCIVTTNKSQHSNKKKPTECVFGIDSLLTDQTIAEWKKI
ncbi:MAG: hypothetical protein Q7R33_04690 [Nitrosarchaeum sp.]|nr:hypothetical protein [Nitrosarchaeum sp.]